MFDYKYLTKYNIDQKLLPDDSIIINAPASNYERYFLYFLAILVVIINSSLYAPTQKSEEELTILKTPDYLTGILNRGTGIAFFTTAN